MTDVSVVIPVYGVEKYLQQNIDSLLNQTLDTCEYIFVNDASPDGCLEILKRNQRKHPDKIRVIDSKENLRQGGARNLGIAAAEGKYIGFVDSDDFVAPDMFMALYEKAEATGADVTYIQFAFVTDGAVYSPDANYEEYQPGTKWRRELLEMQGHKLTDQDISDLLALSTAAIWCGLYRRDLLIGSGVTFPEKRAFEDNYWSSAITPFFSSVAFVEKVGYLYRVNPQSTVHRKNQMSHMADRIYLEHALLEEARARGFFEKYRDAYEWVYTSRFAVNTFDGGVIRFDKLNYALLKDIMTDLKSEFPRWDQNPYYQKCTRKQKLQYKMKINFPEFTATQMKLLQFCWLKLVKPCLIKSGLLEPILVYLRNRG